VLRALCNVDGADRLPGRTPVAKTCSASHSGRGSDETIADLDALPQEFVISADQLRRERFSSDDLTAVEDGLARARSCVDRARSCLDSARETAEPIDGAIRTLLGKGFLGIAQSIGRRVDAALA
jgi:hypothetical protein